MPRLHRVLTATSIAMLVAAMPLHAASDVQVTGSPASVRVLPGTEGDFDVVVTNLGPDVVAPTLNGSIDWPTGYTLSLASPICGALTETPGNWGIDYSVSLSPMEAAQSVTCHFVVARDSNAASDLNLWLASTPDDFNPNNDTVAFAIGSLIDVSVDLTPKWFFIDGDGIGHGSELLYVANHGPSDVDAFEIGACEDNYFPGFTLDGEFAGGCGPSDYGPLCFDDGLGFMMPPLASGAEFRCEIRLTSFEPYQDPLGFEIRTDILPNPAMHGGELLDTDAQDNSVVLLLEPMSTIFANGFGP